MPRISHATFGQRHFMVGRYILGMFQQHQVVGAAVTVNRAYVFPLDIFYRTVTVDALAYVNSPTWAGAYRIGLYGQGTPNTDLPDGATLVWQSASIAVAASDVREAVMPAGIQLAIVNDEVAVRAWIAVIFGDAANELYFATGAGVPFVGGTVECKEYDAGAYALVDPCPVTSQGSRATCVMARIASIP